MGHTFFFNCNWPMLPCHFKRLICLANTLTHTHTHQCHNVIEYVFITLWEWGKKVLMCSIECYYSSNGCYTFYWHAYRCCMVHGLTHSTRWWWCGKKVKFQLQWCFTSNQFLFCMMPFFHAFLCALVNKDSAVRLPCCSLLFVRYCCGWCARLF